MNSQIYFLFFAALCGLVAAQPDYPQATKLNLTSNVQDVHQGQNFQISCDFKTKNPLRNSEKEDKDWEITVGFHKDMNSPQPENRHPALAQYRQNGTNMIFETVNLFPGINVWPADGQTTSTLESPKRITVVPNIKNSVMGSSPYSQWKCSVTMKLKGSEAMVRYFSDGVMLSPNWQ